VIGSDRDAFAAGESGLGDLPERHDLDQRVTDPEI
jgi:hypothetical protein